MTANTSLGYHADHFSTIKITKWVMFLNHGVEFQVLHIALPSCFVYEIFLDNLIMLSGSNMNVVHSAPI